LWRWRARSPVLSGHSFDLARDGYVNLLPGNRRRPADGGDRREQLRHRAAFLAAGHFDFITAKIAERLRQAGAVPAGELGRILDAGCGTGLHLAHITAALGSATTGLGLDISAAAARLAARGWPDIAFAVCDLWTEWPVHDASIGLVMSIFAPRNFAETARVLRPGGWRALVYPGPGHLTELRYRYALLGQRQGKAGHYAEAAARAIGPLEVTRVVRRAVLHAGAVRAAVLMGPNARHLAPAALAARTRPMAVTFDIALLLARKRKSAPRKICSHPLTATPPSSPGKTREC
jgi:23S rRNA (guanine745-N1)-methyltransferase